MSVPAKVLFNPFVWKKSKQNMECSNQCITVGWAAKHSANGLKALKPTQTSEKFRMPHKGVRSPNQTLISICQSTFLNN